MAKVDGKEVFCMKFNGFRPTTEFSLENLIEYLIYFL